MRKIGLAVPVAHSDIILALVSYGASESNEKQSEESYSLSSLWAQIMSGYLEKLRQSICSTHMENMKTLRQPEGMPEVLACYYFWNTNASRIEGKSC